MGSGVSTINNTSSSPSSSSNPSSSSSSSSSSTILEYTIKELPEQIEQSIFIYEKFPLIIDQTNKAKLFLKYQLGSFIKHTEFSQINLNRCLVGALIHGKTITITFDDLKGITYDFFIPNYFPKEVLNRNELYKDGIWQPIFHIEEGDPDPQDITPSPEFVFILCTSTDYIPPDLYSIMRVIKIVDKETSTEQQSNNNNNNNKIDNSMDEIASLYGASEVKRNSTAIVEAGFDGDIDTLKELLDKGYHVESVDGRKHTALSEAACQGQVSMMEYLLSLGADPNSMNDTGRTPLWRASFNGHIEAVKLLLESGGDPDCRDNSSMETAYDVAKTDELRELIGKWDRKLTAELKDKRNKEIEASIIARIKTSVEREEYAKQKLRVEAVQLANSRNLTGLKEFFHNLVEEADQTKTKPRLTVECRNDYGQSLLSIAAQNNDIEMVKFLLTHWKECDKDRWDLATDELSTEAKVFKTNPNSRDLKGWNCVCIAIFHNSLDSLELLLEHGGDPTLKSSYNKNGWDLAKDELDAAGKVVTSRQEVRQILINHENSQSNLTSKNTIFGDSSSSPSRDINIYQDLGHDGSPIVMQLEIENSENMTNKKDGKKSNNTTTKKKDSNNNNNSNSNSNSNNNNTKKKKITGKK